MTWTEVIPAAVALLYIATAAGYGMKGQAGLALAYAAYAVANAGLIVAALEGRA